MYGDALTCIKCGLSAYPEGRPDLLAYAALGRLERNPTPEQLQQANEAVKRRESNERS